MRLKLHDKIYRSIFLMWSFLMSVYLSVGAIFQNCVYYRDFIFFMFADNKEATKPNIHIDTYLESLSFMNWCTFTEYLCLRCPWIRTFCLHHNHIVLSSFMTYHRIWHVTWYLTWVRWLGLLVGQETFTAQRACIPSRFLMGLDHCLSFCKIIFFLAIVFSDRLRFSGSG